MANKSPFLLTAAMVSLSGLMTGLKAEAKDWHLIDLNESSVNYQRFISDGRDPYIYPSVHKEAINLTTNMDVFRFFFLDTRVLSITDDGQYKSVGLNLKLGIRFTDFLSIQYEHLSVHQLDSAQTIMPKYPVSDSVGFVLKFYQSPSPREGLL